MEGRKVLVQFEGLNWKSTDITLKCILVRHSSGNSCGNNRRILAFSNEKRELPRPGFNSSCRFLYPTTVTATLSTPLALDLL